MSQLLVSKERVFVLAYKVGKCRLSLLLKDSEMSQRELALKLGVTDQQVNKYYRDRQKMSIQVAKNVSDILKCNIEDLYEWIEITGNIE